MKKTLYLLLISIAFISCTPENELEGVWMGAYQIHYSKNDTSYFPVRRLFDFSENHLKVKTFGSQSFNSRDTLESFKFTRIDQKLIVEKDTFIIINLAKDSLVLSLTRRPEHWVFKRLIENEKKPIRKLTNQAYSIEGRNYTDSLDFINDSILLHIGNEYSTYRAESWAIETYKSYNFLVIDGWGWVPLLIDNSTENQWDLKQYYTKIQMVKMTRIQSPNDSSLLIGNWIWPHRNDKGLPPPPIPPNFEENTDPYIYLNIKEDSLQLKQFGRSYSKEWKFNSIKNFVYFPKDIQSRKGVWKIISCTQNHLTIERANENFHSKKEKQILDFERVKNSGSD